MFRYIATLLVCFFSGLLSFAYGQEAQIQGQVLDPSRAGIARALVRVVDQRTGTEAKTETDNNGEFTVAGLAPGLYIVYADSPGFSTAISDAITLNPTQHAVLNFTLKVDATSADVIVTAEKREERAIDVPGSVTAVETEPLVSNGQVLLRDYYTQIPGFSVSPNINADQVLSIRGISTAGSSNPTVGVLIDDAPYASRNSVPDVDPEDLARIEVLRGPQGTLYGANSMGGLINYVTADPSTTKMFGRIEAGTSTTENGAEPNYDLRGSINVPIREDLAVRLSGFMRQDAGYIDNVRFNLRGVNETEADGARLAALWQPNSQLAIRLSAIYQHTTAPGGTEVVPSLGQYKINLLPDEGAYSYRPQIYNARINYQFGNFSLASITSYSDNDYWAITDFSSFYGTDASSVFNQDVGVSFDYTQSGMRRVTQEVRLASGTSESVEWMIGGFGSYVIEPNIWHMDGRDVTTGANVGRFWNYTAPEETQEYAAFANAKVKLSHRFDMQFGARENRSLAKNLDAFESGPAISVLNYAAPFSPGVTSTADKFTYMAAPAYHIAPDVMVYARVATGFRPPVPNPLDTVAQGAPATVRPDTSTNYEGGLKGDFLKHALTIEAAGYRIDWSDIQLQLETTGSGGFYYLGNGGGATSQGFELTTDGRPTRSLSLNGWVSYDDAKITKGFAQGVPGDKLPFAPHFSAFGSAEQDFTLSPSWTAYLEGSLSYVGQRTGTFIGVGDPRQIYPSYTKADLRFGARSDRWRAELYSTNLSNSNGELNGGLGYNTPSAFIDIPPRTFGASVERKF